MITRITIIPLNMHSRVSTISPGSYHAYQIVDGGFRRFAEVRQKKSGLATTDM